MIEYVPCSSVSSAVGQQPQRGIVSVWAVDGGSRWVRPKGPADHTTMIRRRFIQGRPEPFPEQEVHNNNIGLTIYEVRVADESAPVGGL